MSARKKVMGVTIFGIMIALTGAIAGFIAFSEDDWILEQVYRYRTMVTRYDSVVVGCTFGEICIPDYNGSGDSLMIEWEQHFDTPGIDSSASYIGSIARSKPFHLTSTTELSLYQMIFMQYDSANYSLPDTSAWTIELWNHELNKKIATIDSVGICRAINIAPTEFPDLFGFTATAGYEITTIALGTYSSVADSAFIILKAYNWNDVSNDSCTMYDEISTNTKFTERLGLNKSVAHFPVMPANLHVSAFPNPTSSQTIFLKYLNNEEQHVALSIYDEKGALVDEIFSGIRPAGLHAIPYRFTNRSSGVFFLRASLSDGSTSNTYRLVVIK